MAINKPSPPPALIIPLGLEDRTRQFYRAISDRLESLQGARSIRDKAVTVADMEQLQLLSVGHKDSLQLGANSKPVTLYDLVQPADMEEYYKIEQVKPDHELILYDWREKDFRRLDWRFIQQAFALTNVGTGARVHKDTVDIFDVPTARLRSIIGEGGIVIREDDNEIAIIGCCDEGFNPQTFLRDTAGEVCSARGFAPNVDPELGYIPAAHTPGAQAGDLAVFICYSDRQLLEAVFDVTLPTGWTIAVPLSNSTKTGVYYKFLTTADLNTNHNFVFTGLGTERVCRTVFVYSNVNTYHPFSAILNDGEQWFVQTPPTFVPYGPGKAPPLLSTSQHIINLTYFEVQSATPKTVDDVISTPLGEITPEVAIDKSFPYIDSDNPQWSHRVQTWAGSVSNDENLIPNENATDSCEDASWTNNGCTVARDVSDAFTQITGSAAATKNSISQSITLAIGESVSFYVRATHPFGNGAGDGHVFVEDPSANERGLFVYYNFTQGYSYSSSYADPLSDRGTVWEATFENEGSGAGWYHLVFTAQEAGVHKFHVGAGAEGRTTPTFTFATNDKLNVYHVGMRRGRYREKEIWTGSAAVTNGISTGLGDNFGGYATGVTHRGGGVTLVVNPISTRYLKGKFQYSGYGPRAASTLESSGNLLTVRPGLTNGISSDGQVWGDRLAYPTDQNGNPGKYYWEAVVQALPGGSTTSNEMRVGMMAGSTFWPGVRAVNYGATYAYEVSATAMAVNDVWGVALDYENHEIKWYKNGSLQGTTSNIADLPLAPHLELGDGPGTRAMGGWDAYFKAPFVQTIPTGFQELDFMGDVGYSIGDSFINIGGGAEIVIPGDPTQYRTLVSGDMISITQQDETVLFEGDIVNLTVLGTGQVDGANDTVAIYDASAGTIKQVAAEELGGDSSPTTTQGDLIVRGASVDERLAIGAADTVLTSNGTTATWAAPSGGGGSVEPVEGGISKLGTAMVITSDATYADSNIALTLEPGTYTVQVFLETTVNATPGMSVQLAFTGTYSSAAFQRTAVRTTTGGFAQYDDLAEYSMTISDDYAIVLTGTITVTAVGTLKVQAKQNTSSGTSVTLHAGSWMSVDGGGGGGSVAFSGARASRTTNLAVNSVFTPIAFDTEDYDTDGMWEGVTNPSRFTAPTAGYYTLTAQMLWASSSTNSNMGLFISKDGSASTAANRVASTYYNQYTTTNNPRQNVTWTGYLSAGSYLMVEAYSTINRNLDASEYAWAEFHRLNSGGGGGTVPARCARVTKSSTQSCTGSASTNINWDDEEFDTGGMWAPGNPSRLTAPADGKYLVTSSTRLVGGGGHETSFIVNGSTATRYGNDRGNVTSPSCVLNLTAGDYVEVRIYNEGATANFQTIEQLTHFAMVELTDDSSGAGGASATNGCEVSRSTDQSLTSAFDAIEFVTEDKDDAGYWNSGSPDRFIIPETGWYAGYVFARLSDNAGVGLWVTKNNASDSDANAIAGYYDSTATGGGRITVPFAGYFTAGDYLRFITYSSVANTLDGTSTPARAVIYRPSGAVDGGGGGGGYVTANDNGALLERTTDQSLTASTWAAVQFDTEVRDDADYADLGTNNDRFTIPETGWYLLTGYVFFESTSQSHALAIGLNGDPTTTANEYSAAYQSPLSGARLNISMTAYLTAGDYVGLYAWSAGAGTVEGATNPARFAIHRLSGGDASFMPRYLEYFEDFVENVFYLTANTNGWSYSTASGGSIDVNAAASGHQGVTQIVSGTSSGGLSQIGIGASGPAGNDRKGFIVPTAGTGKLCMEWYAKTNFDTAAGNTYHSMHLQANDNDYLGIYFDSSGCQLRSVSSASATATVAAPQHSSGTWHKFKVEADSAGVELFIDGVSAASHTTNIPSVVMGPRAYVYNNTTAGTSYTLDIDWLRIWNESTDRIIDAPAELLTPWEQYFFDDLDNDHTDWTADFGTWTDASGYLTSSPGNTVNHRLRYDNRIPHSNSIIECELYYDGGSTLHSGGGAHLGFKFLSDGVGTGDPYAKIAWTNKSSSVTVGLENQALINRTLFTTDASGTTLSAATDTWHKLRVEVASGMYDLYLNDIFVGTGYSPDVNTTSPDKVGLVCYQGTFRFRNFRTFRLKRPAP